MRLAVIAAAPLAAVAAVYLWIDLRAFYGLAARDDLARSVALTVVAWWGGAVAVTFLFVLAAAESLRRTARAPTRFRRVSTVLIVLLLPPLATAASLVLCVVVHPRAPDSTLGGVWIHPSPLLLFGPFLLTLVAALVQSRRLAAPSESP